MFETDEVKPQVDKAGNVTGFKRTKYTESHQLIEELMLLANREVAAKLAQAMTNQDKNLRRSMPCVAGAGALGAGVEAGVVGGVV
jgi:exoribonuclease R